MEPNQALAKAKEFARTAYNADMETIVRDTQTELGEMRSRLAARDTLISGTQIHEQARIYKKQIQSLAESRLKALLDGYELYDIEVDDNIKATIVDDIMELWNTKVSHAQQTLPTWGGSSAPAGVATAYAQLMTQGGISVNWVKTQVDRRKLVKKQQSSASPVYHLVGHNPRVNINSNDLSVNSVNIVTKTGPEIFADLRHRIESHVSEGNQQVVILEKLDALEKAQGSKSFATRYAEFVAVVADHIAVITPFIPALTEMLHKVL